MKLRQKVFYFVVIIGSPIWASILFLMLCLDIAQNFIGQINAGYRMIMTKEGMQ